MRHNTTKKLTTALATTFLSVFIPACMGVSVRPIISAVALRFGTDLYHEFAKKQENASLIDSPSYNFWHYSGIIVDFASWYHIHSSQSIFNGNNEFKSNMVSAITSSKDVCHASPYAFWVSGYLFSPSFLATGMVMSMYDQILNKSINNAVGVIVGNDLTDKQMSIIPNIIESARTTLYTGVFAGIGGFRFLGSLPFIGGGITDQAAGRVIGREI